MTKTVENEGLTPLRNRLDEIDQWLVADIVARFETVQKIGAYKRSHQIALLDSVRETKVLEHVATLTKDPELTPLVQEIYQAILVTSKQRQRSQNEGGATR